MRVVSRGYTKGSARVSFFQVPTGSVVSAECVGIEDVISYVLGQ